MNGARLRPIALPWYERSDYTRILEIMEDREFFNESFDQWLSGARQAETELAASGRITVRAHIEPEAFVAWCALHGLKVDDHARDRWGAQAIREAIADQGRNSRLAHADDKGGGFVGEDRARLRRH
jgi:hypothetical protein